MRKADFLARVVPRVVELTSGFGKRRITTFAAASAFYMFLSLFPLVTLVCTLLPYTPLTEAGLLEMLRRVFPAAIFTLFSGIVEDVYSASGATTFIAAVAAVWSAALAVTALMRGLDVAYGVERKMNFIVLRLRACFFMVIMLASILVTLCGLVYGQRILDLIEANLPASWDLEPLLTAIGVGRYFVMTGFLFLVFLLFYRWMPAGKRGLLAQWRGALFTTAAWLVFSWAFSIYQRLSDRYGIYGLLGTVVVAMLWMYYCMLFLLAGGYLNASFDAKKE